MRNALTRTTNKSSASAYIEEISVLLEKISENAKLTRENDKELKRLRKLTDKSFADMRKTVNRVVAS